MILDALARHADARAAIDAAFTAEGLAPPNTSRGPLWEPSELPASERARAHATRGLAALRAGDPAAATADLRRAFEIEASAAHAHALGATLYAGGEIADAAAYEARSVELAPDVTRYRWALVVSLLRLGRREAAREHMETILLQEPADPRHRVRMVRLFGA